MLTDPLRETAAAWLAEARQAMLVEVLASRGSVPREAGTRLLVAADAVAGTIGGGHLELKAIERARQRLADGSVEPDDLHYPLGPALGQCCGGAVTLRTQPLTAARLADWPLSAPLFDLQLYGAGHVGRAIVRLLETLPCRIQWIDEREAEFPASPSATPAAQVERVCVDAVAAEVRAAPPGACVLVMTHSHALDLAIVEAALARDDLGFVGLIGSATKRARFVRRLEARGLPAQRLHCPIGLPGITGKAPEVIAVSVVAQLLTLGERRQAQASAHRPGDPWSAARASDQLSANRPSASVSSTLSV